VARVRPATLLILTALCALAGALIPHSFGQAQTTTAPRKGARVVKAHAADSCADATLTPDEGNLPSIRAATLCLINRERGAHGESPLKPDAALESSAQAHSDSMVSADYFEHVGPNGQTPLSRMRSVGYIANSRDGYVIGENIAWGTLWLGAPRAIVAQWMASPGHRANILNARFRETGIGVSAHVPASVSGGQTGAIYTQDFGAIIAP